MMMIPKKRKACYQDGLVESNQPTPGTNEMLRVTLTRRDPFNPETKMPRIPNPQFDLTPQWSLFRFRIPIGMGNCVLCVNFAAMS